MLTIDEAFRKFKSRLELNDKEQANASARQNEVRDYLDTKFAIDTSFLTGSYRRHTKTKPLKDIDIFFVLKESERYYRDKAPSVVIKDFYDALVEKYGKDAVRKQSRSVNVDFGVFVDVDDNTDYRVLSVDVVPAFAKGDDYEIPDTDTGKWIETNPKIHANKATTAHQAFSSEWKGLVRMVKYWNNNPKHGADKPVKPSFLIEVMALECLHSGWQGQFDYEIQGLFATLADRIFDTWPDPAGLGPAVSNGMDSAHKQRACDLLVAAGRDASLAINHTRQNRNGEALAAWRGLFGTKFPLS
ncbi:MAG TPA: CBASS oligonucleotide cyclase [Bauldia sp.]